MYRQKQPLDYILVFLVRAGGGVPPSFTCFVRLNSLRGAEGIPFGECWRSQKFLPLPLMGKAPTIKRPCGMLD